MSNPEYHGVEPALETWLRETVPDVPREIREQRPLTALMVASGAKADSDDIPDEILVNWHRLVAQDRLELYQSERSFIVRARSQGWTWDRLATVLGLNSRQAAQQRLAALEGKIKNVHPSNSTVPWIN